MANGATDPPGVLLIIGVDGNAVALGNGCCAPGVMMVCPEFVPGAVGLTLLGPLRFDVCAETNANTKTQMITVPQNIFISFPPTFQFSTLLLAFERL